MVAVGAWVAWVACVAMVAVVACVAALAGVPEVVAEVFVARRRAVPGRSLLANVDRGAADVAHVGATPEGWGHACG